MAKGMLVEQPRLGKAGMVLLIALCSVVAPFSTDMYMPALPEMKVFFGTTDAILNRTLVLFFLFFAVGTLIFGPISERNGRRPVLAFGLIMYSIASLGCIFAPTIELLIGVRIVQALGAGCMIAVSTAIVKDQFEGTMQGTVLTITQVFSGIGPILAPVVGAFIYALVGWRMVFVFQVAFGIVILVIVLLMNETLPRDLRLDTGVIRSLTRLGVVMRNKAFALFMLGIVTLHVPMMAYVASSSYVYQDFFAFSPNKYTAFFAVTALFSIIGPITYSVIKRQNPFKMSFVLLGIPAVVGIVLLLFGHGSPVLYLIMMAVLMMCAAATRPFSMTILLNLQERDAGAASALINFAFTFMGTIGMFLITGLWHDYILGMGILCVAAGVIGAILVAVLLKKEGPHSLDVF